MKDYTPEHKELMLTIKSIEPGTWLTTSKSVYDHIIVKFLYFKNNVRYDGEVEINYMEGVFDMNVSAIQNYILNKL